MLNKTTPLAHIVEALNGDWGHATQDYECWQGELNCNIIAPTTKLSSWTISIISPLLHVSLSNIEQ